MKHISIFIFLSFLLITNTISQTDIRNVQVDKLSDEQVLQVAKKIEGSGMSQQQAEAAAIAKGMNPQEIQKLKDRAARIDRNKKNKTNLESYTESTRQTEDQSFDIEQEKGAVVQDSVPNVFGFSLFNTKNLTFEPSLNLPTPQNYQIGPGDQLIIDIWGASQANYKMPISPEGVINVENVGPIYVNGLTIEAAIKKIIARLSSIYAGLNGSNPNTYAQISLGNLRRIKVSVIGEARLPGTYTLTSLATVFNALYVSGGPGKNGSLRNVLVFRENKLVSTLDAYEFLINGDQKNNIRLQDQDIVLIKPYKARIELVGEVKNPAIYEVKENENIYDVINFAGGFNDKAYTYRLKVVRYTDRQYKIVDVQKDQFSAFALINGDVLTIEPILKTFENRVEVQGAVFRPGQYELTNGLTIKELINDKAEGLKGDAFMHRAILYRSNPDLTVSAIAFGLDSLFSGLSPNILLQKEDAIRIFSIYELQEEYTIEISGEINKPGRFKYIKELTLGDIIATAGGFKESASQTNVEISRRIKSVDINSKEANIAAIYKYTVSKDLFISDSASKFKLEPFDQISIRRSPGYEIQTQANITGEVLYPGNYSIKTKDERISDLINRAGGLTLEAYPKGAKLIRKLSINRKERQKILENISENSNDSINTNFKEESEEQAIGISLEKILKNPHSKYDLLVQEGDRLEIPKELQTVKLSGAVLYPITVRYDRSYRFKSYIANAGGYSENARPKKAYVIYPNGSVDKTSSFFGIKNYPRIEPGAEIIIPKKAEKSKMTTQEVVGLSTAMTSLALIIVTIINSISW